MGTAGNRVVLRELRSSDRDEFLERVRASRRFHRPWAHPPDTPEGFDALLRRAEAPSERVHLIRRAEDDAMVGVGNLSQISLGNLRSAYIGYFGFRPYDGLGYMTEGVGLVLRVAFEDIGLTGSRRTCSQRTSARSRSSSASGSAARGTRLGT